MLYYEAQPKALPESIDYDDFIIATYYAALPRDMIMYYLAPFLAVEQSTGTWTAVPGETPEVQGQARGQGDRHLRGALLRVRGAQGGGGAHLRRPGGLPLPQHRAPDTHAAHRRAGEHLHGRQDQAARPALAQAYHRRFRGAQVRHRRHLQGAGDQGAPPPPQQHDQAVHGLFLRDRGEALLRGRPSAAATSSRTTSSSRTWSSTGARTGSRPTWPWRSGSSRRRASTPCTR